MRALLDTCIIIDALQNREPFSKNAQAIFLLAANQQFIGCITAKSSTDIYYLMHHFTHDDKQSRAVLSKLFTLFDVLDTAGIDCRQAIPTKISDYEDAVMVATATRSLVDCIVTRNIHDYVNSFVSVFTPEEFIAKINDDNE